MRLIKTYLLLIICFSSWSLIKAQDATQSENEKNLQTLVERIQIGEAEGGDYYNAACYAALLGKSDEAFRYLAGAVKLGYVDVERIKTDTDLNSLHADARWQPILDKASAKLKTRRTAFYNQKTFWDSPALNTPYKENLSEDEKIAGLSKFWSEVKYDFANFDLVPDLNWDATYLEYLPKVKQTKSTFEYYKVLQEMCAKLKDGHTNVFFPKELTDIGSARPLIRTRLIEDKVIIIRVFDEGLKQKGIEIGQEVTEVNGLPVKDYAAKFVAPFQSASTSQDLDTRSYEYFLFSGAATEPLNLMLRKTDGSTFQATLPRLTGEARTKLNLPAAQPFEFKTLPGNIAYVALNDFGTPKAADDFTAAFDEIAKSDALIIDVRNNGGGSSNVGYRVLSYLTDKPFKTSQWYTRDYRPSFRPWERPQDMYGSDAGSFTPNGKKLYTRPVVVLTSSRTFSAAEDFAVAYVSMKRGLVIGEPTGGSTGQPLSFTLPGGGSARVCSKRDRFPDGKEFVGAGIQPDKLIRPTITDFRAGRDTVLEAAIKELKLAESNK